MKLSTPLNLKLTSQLLAMLALASQITACVPVVVGGAAAGGSIVADRRTSGVFLEDQNIEIKASHRIENVVTNLSHVNVTSYKGNVLVTGEVPDEITKTKVGNTVKVVESVRNVTNDLAIGPKSSLSSRTNDGYITSKVKAQFVAENRFPANYVKVVTENSVVYLMGYVTQAEGDAAAEIARNTTGVVKVVKVFEYMP